MKTLKSVFVLLAFVAVTFLGCSDQSQSPIAPNANDNTVTSLMKPGSGAFIIKHDEEIWWWFINDTGLMIILGINDVAEFCDGTGGIDLMSIRDIYLPNADPNLRRLVAHQHGNNYTARAWQVDAPPAYEDLCDFLNNQTPLAIGTAKLIYNDNDYYAWLQDNNNVNAFGYKANGTLTGVDLKVYKLNLLYKIVWDPDGTKFNENFKLQLTPTGK